jgi:thioredoxin reductase (NADPH)
VLSVTSDGAVKKVKTTYSEYESKAVIIANGVKHRTLGLEHEDELTGRGVYYCAVCDGGYMRGFRERFFAFSGRELVVSLICGAL